MKIIDWIKNKKSVLIACIVTAIITWVFNSFLYLKSEGFSYRYVKYLLDRYYVDDVNEQKLIEGSINGMFETLDDVHSLYIPSSYGYDKFDSNVTGEFVGIGISIKNVDGNSVVSKVFENSPADVAGVLEGDIIFGADDIDLIGKDTNEISNVLQGEEGTTFTLKVSRQGEIVEISNIERKKISAPSVKAKSLDDNIGYMCISSFDADTDIEISKALKKLQSNKALILDLRDNPGGRLDVVTKSIDLFLDRGIVIITKYKDCEEQVLYSEDGVEYDKPVCVLVNENSASAAEIFAAAFKERERGKIVGTLTYGKGSIQRTFPLPNNAAANITIGRFYSPNGNAIDKVGVTPDTEVSLSEEYKNISVWNIPYDKDLQLQKAIEILNN